MQLQVCATGTVKLQVHFVLGVFLLFLSCPSTAALRTIVCFPPPPALLADFILTIFGTFINIYNGMTLLADEVKKQ